MKITARKTNTKRHTTAWKVAGKWHTRSQAYELAKAGRIEGVTAYRRGKTRYVQSLPGHKNLYDLPEIVES